MWVIFVRIRIANLDTDPDTDPDLDPTDLNTIHENIFRWGPDDIKKEDMDHIIKEQIQLFYGDMKTENVEKLALCYIICSVADPDPGSGMGKNQDQDYISESLETIFWAKILKFFDVNPDPGSGIFLTLDHISESLETIFWVKIHEFFDADPDPESF